MIKKRKWPLFEKSGAKTFIGLGRAGRRAIGLKKQSFFATFCSQKVAFFFPLP
ncbi:MAG TPA: hypothetical protein VL356_12445 [Acidocella sp.]|nr:hypothetical protein [Acidocella sp.]